MSAQCICDGAAYEQKRHPFLVHSDCPVHSPKGCGGSGTCAIGMADLECPNCPVEWGVRYLNGVVMKRFSREIAEASVRQFPRRKLMWRVSDGWHEYSVQTASCAVIR